MLFDFLAFMFGVAIVLAFLYFGVVYILLEPRKEKHNKVKNWYDPIEPGR